MVKSILSFCFSSIIIKLRIPSLLLACPLYMNLQRRLSLHQKQPNRQQLLQQLPRPSSKSRNTSLHHKNKQLPQPVRTVCLRTLELTKKAAGVQGVPVQRQQQEEIRNYLLSTQKYYQPRQLSAQLMQDRIAVINWLVELQTVLRLSQETLFLSVNLVDQYLQQKDVRPSRLQLLGGGALLVAAKFQQTYRVPKVKDIQFLCSNAYSIEQIKEEERRLLEMCKFKVHRPLIFTFLYFHAHKLQEKDRHLANFISELTLLKREYLKARASTLAVAVVYLVNKIRSMPPDYNLQLVKDTQLDESEVRMWAKQLCLQLNSCEEQQNQIREKYGRAEYGSISKVKLEKRTPRN